MPGALHHTPSRVSPERASEAGGAVSLVAPPADFHKRRNHPALKLRSLHQARSAVRPDRRPKLQVSYRDQPFFDLRRLSDLHVCAPSELPASEEQS
jgi:hypothetical protein